MAPGKPYDPPDKKPFFDKVMDATFLCIVLSLTFMLCCGVAAKLYQVIKPWLQ